MIRTRNQRRLMGIRSGGSQIQRLLGSIHNGDNKLHRHHHSSHHSWAVLTKRTNFPQQPGQFGVPPVQPAKPTFKQRFQGMPRWKCFATIGCSTLIAVTMLCSLCAVVAAASPKSPQQPSSVNAGQVSPTTEHQVAPTRKPKPTATPSPTPTPMPTPTLHQHPS